MDVSPTPKVRESQAKLTAFQEARQEVSMLKVVVANCFLAVLDRAMQVHGAMGVSNDTPLARMWAHARTLRLVDGPDEGHKMVIARRESRRQTAGECG